jgi:hypothetical protein
MVTPKRKPASTAENPVHPLNPCQWGEAAKFWELLRRNDAFKSETERILRIHQKIRTPGCDPRGHLGFAFHQHLNKLSSENACAGHAIRWLIPEPRFGIHKSDGSPAQRLFCQITNCGDLNLLAQAGVAVREFPAAIGAACSKLLHGPLKTRAQAFLELFLLAVCHGAEVPNFSDIRRGEAGQAFH